MKFGAVPLEQALGAILAHSADLRGRRLRKGKILNADDLSRMADEGWQDVIVARLTPDDMDENAAAASFASALSADVTGMVRASVAATGRVNLYSEAAGIVLFDPAMIDAINDVNPMITVATVLPHHRVIKGDMIATIKIIAYGVPRGDVDKALYVVTHSLKVQQIAYRTATLIETQIGVVANDKGREALRARLDRLGAGLTDRCIVPHEAKPLAKAISEAAGDAVFILTASATSDPQDVGPSAVIQAGGQITRFGMPVDPGNLLFLGSMGAKPIIGLPGCARSPALNGADWVLERVLCGQEVTHKDIAGMGVGGLLKEIPTRPQPRDAHSSKD